MRLLSLERLGKRYGMMQHSKVTLLTSERTNENHLGYTAVFQKAKHSDLPSVLQSSQEDKRATEQNSPCPLSWIPGNAEEASWEAENTRCHSPRVKQTQGRNGCALEAMAEAEGSMSFCQQSGEKAQ